MKKILLLTLCLVALLSFCACRNTNTNGTDTNTDSSVSSTNNGTNDSTNNNDEGSNETGYVGTWVYEKQTSKGPFKIKLVINEDGTATRTVGKTETYLIWYEDVDSDEIEGAIELSSEDKKGFGDDAYITEDGKLYLGSSGTILGELYDHLIFERQ